MTITAQDLVTRAMKALQALGSDEVPTAAESNDGLTALNAMIDSWSNENLMLYQIQEQSFTLSVGVSQYTIGSGGTINVTRPLVITQAYVQDTSTNKYLMKIVERPEWNELTTSGSQETSQIPEILFYDPAFPLGIINIFPVPLLSYSVYFDSRLQLSQLATLTTALSLPVGYERALVYNLAVEISSMFGIPIPPVPAGAKNVGMLADEAKANVKRTNMPEVIASYSDAIVSRSYATYNIYRDGPG